MVQKSVVKSLLQADGCEAKCTIGTWSSYQQSKTPLAYGLRHHFWS